jgi:hypothetical protein
MAGGSRVRGSRIRQHGAALGAVGVLLLVAACSSSGGGSSTPSSTPTTTAAAPTTAAATPSSTGTVAAPAPCGTQIAPSISGTGPADTTTAGDAVATDYAKFFDPKTSSATKLSLLQNGAALSPVVASFSGNALAGKATVTVTGVNFTGPTAAAVIYNLCEGGSPVLPGSAGQAVLTGSTWQVADATLCGLVKLNNGGKAVPGCS